MLMHKFPKVSTFGPLLFLIYINDLLNWQKRNYQIPKYLKMTLHYFLLFTINAVNTSVDAGNNDLVKTIKYG